MIKPQPFEVATAPLDRGVTLIEASAGTGKTYSIAALFLRFVLEEGLPIQKILAVTYTVAATQELRERIRKRLRDALASLRAHRAGTGEAAEAPAMPAGGDPVVTAFLGNHRDPHGLARGIQALELAVQSFDEAPIFTIHGFCQRALQDHAFESGMRYDAEPLLDPRPLFEEVAHDFWRHTFYEATPLFAALALTGNFARASSAPSPASWAALLERTRNHPNLAILPAPEGNSATVASLGTIAGEVAAAFEIVRSAWPDCREAVAEILRNDKGLSRAANTFRADRVEELLAQLESLAPGTDLQPCGDSGPDPDCLDALTFLCTPFLAANLKRGKAAPEHPFFDQCQAFCSAVERYFSQLTHDFLAYAETELAQRKRERNLLTFDDLLTGLNRALEGPGGASLAAALGAKYEAALIDEFQDTDPLQAAIFKRLFAGEQGHWLFLIGDPKQAIYGFRGADVFTYLNAAASASRRYNLAVNRRSDAPLLAGFNTLFTQGARPFVIPEIEYHPVHAPPQAPDAEPPGPSKQSAPPLEFRYLPAPEGESNPFNKADAVALTAQTVAEDIGRLQTLEGWKPGEMAVLVRSHRNAAAIQEALTARGIQSVLHTDESVFHSEEAEAIGRLLDAVAEPRNDSRMKAALAIRLFGRDAASLAALETDESGREQWRERFLTWHGLWENGCFIAMFRRVLTEENIRQRLLQSAGGQRRLTNVLHLAEFLHNEETARKLAPEALCDWLREQRFAQRSTTEAAQLRLESDDDAVTIATVHKSKGLEYPVVFCPFLWIPADSPKRDLIYFHDAGGQITLDLRGKKNAPPEHVERYREETLAEEARLLYVALTRAKHRCVVYAGDFKDANDSALANLFAAGGEAVSLKTGLERLAAATPESVALKLIGAEAPSKNERRAEFHEALTSIAARQFSGTLSRTAFMTSFTSLIKSAAHEASINRESGNGEANMPVEVVEVREVEETAGFAASRENPIPAAASAIPTASEAPEENTPAHGIFRFNKGTRAGDFFHDLLEELDFQNPGELDTLLPEKLALYGFGGSPFEGALNAKLRELLEVELAPGLRLNQIAREDRMSEAEFTCRLPSLQPDDLRKVFAEHGGPAPGEVNELSTLDPVELGRLRFSPVRGFLRGAIDLFFRHEGRYYLLDWKSNWLGNAPQDYDAPGIAAAMRQHHYALQAHLYVLAADRYLNARLPGYDYERDFGGVFYVFLRGVDRDRPARAIYHTKPALPLVTALRRLTEDSPHG